MNMNNWIIVTGSPLTGLEFIGPFASRKDADRFVDQHIHAECWIALMDSPEDVIDSKRPLQMFDGE